MTAGLANGHLISNPFSVDINLTNRCNLSCAFCSATPGHHSRRNDELTLPELVSLFDELEQMGVFVVRLAGGEPLVRKDIIEIISAASDRIFEPLLLTNGMLLNQRIVDAMLEADMGSIAISVDGNTPETHDAQRNQRGALARLSPKLELLRENGICFGAMTTITKVNCSHLIDIVKFLQQQGFSSVNFILLNFSGLARFSSMFPTWQQWQSSFLNLSAYLRDEKPDIRVSILPPHEDAVPYEIYQPLHQADRLDELFDVWGIHTSLVGGEETDIGCAAGRTQMTVFENGDVFGCELMRDAAAMRAGNVRESSLRSIWADSAIFHSLRSMRKADLDGSCSQCPLQCGGGCRASAANITGAIVGSDENCHMYR